MTETTMPLSEFGGSPSQSFLSSTEIGESDIHPLLLQTRTSTKSLHSSTPSLNLEYGAEGSQLRIHQIRAQKRLSAPETLSPLMSISGSDYIPSAPMRKSSMAYEGSISSHQSNSGHQQLSVTPQMNEEEEEEDDTMHDDEDDVLSPVPKTLARRLSDSEKRFADDSADGSRTNQSNTNTPMKMPLRKSSTHTRSIDITQLPKDENNDDDAKSQVASDSQKNDHQSASSPGSSVVTDEAIETMILSQIPAHIRNQMTPEMWKQIFTVKTVSKLSETQSVCSELTDDLASKMNHQPLSPKQSPPPTQRHSIDHTGLVEDITSPSMSGGDDFVKENLESHSTFRTFVTDDQSKDTAEMMDLTSDKDLLDAVTPASIRSTSSTKDEDTNTSTASPETSPFVKRRSLDLSSKAAATTMVPRSKRPGRRRSSDSYESSGHRRSKRPGRRSSTDSYENPSSRRRRSEEWKEHSSDFAPSIPKKRGSIRSRRGVLDMDDEDLTQSPSTSRRSVSRSTSGRRIPKKRQYSVRFCPEAYIRNHERVLEVHPSTSSGPSVGIGWEYYESTSKVSWCPSPNKRYSDMLLSRQERERMVRVEMGYTPKQIAKAVRETLKIKNQRRRTVNNLAEYGSFAPVEKVEYTLEKIQRKLGKLTKLGRKSSSSASAISSSNKSSLCKSTRSETSSQSSSQ